jgi:hypothetical protein
MINQYLFLAHNSNLTKTFKKKKKSQTESYAWKYRTPLALKQELHQPPLNSMTY